jgi:hypothetical protein
MAPTLIRTTSRIGLRTLFFTNILHQKWAGSEGLIMVTDKNTHAPVIVDLGNRRGRAIKDLKNGTGELMLEVDHAVDHVVVILYRKKRRKRGGRMSDIAYSPLNPLSFLRC